MAAIHDLLAQIQDEALRERIEKEIDKLSKTKKFGLVFEEHMPECTPLYDVPVKRGSTVAKKDGNISDIYTVQLIKGQNAICIKKSSDMVEEIPIPIYREHVLGDFWFCHHLFLSIYKGSRSI